MKMVLGGRIGAMDQSCSLNVYVEEHVEACLEPFLDRAPVCSVELAVDLRPLQKTARTYSLLEFLPRQEMIILPGNFAGAHLPGGAGNGEPQLRKSWNCFPDNSGFSGPGRGGYYEELPAGGWRRHWPFPGSRRVLKLLYQVGLFTVSIQNETLSDCFGLNARQDYMVAVRNDY